MAIELTSSSTRHEDVRVKFRLYQDVLKVQEYFLFDPHCDYLNPPLQGYRLRRGLYRPIRPVKGRLVSQVLGLHLERNRQELRLYDPALERWLPTPQEKVSQLEAARRRAEADAEQEKAARQEAEAEAERLRRELEALRRRWPRKT